MGGAKKKKKEFREGFDCHALDILIPPQEKEIFFLEKGLGFLVACFVRTIF